VSPASATARDDVDVSGGYWSGTRQWRLPRKTRGPANCVYGAPRWPSPKPLQALHTVVTLSSVLPSYSPPLLSLSLSLRVSPVSPQKGFAFLPTRYHCPTNTTSDYSGCKLSCAFIWQNFLHSTFDVLPKPGGPKHGDAILWSIKLLGIYRFSLTDSGVCL